MQVASNSAQNAEKDACETEDADKLKNVALATYKASSASVRSLEAAEAAAEAEKLATEATSLATKAGTALALSNALSTAQAFNGVCSSWRLVSFQAEKLQRAGTLIDRHAWCYILKFIENIQH